MEWKYERREPLLWELNMTELCGKDEQKIPNLWVPRQKLSKRSKKKNSVCGTCCCNSNQPTVRLDELGKYRLT